MANKDSSGGNGKKSDSGKKSRRGGRGRRRGRGRGRGGRNRRRRTKGFRVLGRTTEEMTQRFGEPTSRSDTVLVWTDGKDELKRNLIECLVLDDVVKTARIVPGVATRMSKDQILRTVARYNGNNIEKPERAPHTVSGGAGALAFKGDYWAYVQTDPLGCVYGIKIWKEPLVGDVMTT